MKLGMFTSGYQYYPLEAAFQDAKRIGYDYIELWGGRPHAFPPDLKRGGIEQVKKLIEVYECRFMCIHRSTMHIRTII